MSTFFRGGKSSYKATEALKYTQKDDFQADMTLSRWSAILYMSRSVFSTSDCGNFVESSYGEKFIKSGNICL